MTEKGRAEDLGEIRRLWDICFPEDKKFNDYFFENKFNIESVIVCKKDNKIVSMLQRIPYTLYPKGTVSYIYGACTHPDYRKRHFMERLLKYSEETDKKEGFSGSVLVPQNEGLFAFYEKYGFECMFYHNEESIAENIASAKK